MSDAGERVRLEPTIQCKHWKRWTLRSWLRTDVMARALPWSRLLAVRGDGVPDTLNLGLVERASAALACLSLASLLTALTVPGVSALAGVGAALAAAGFVTLQLGLVRFLARAGGVGFAAAATLMHATYFVYSSVVYAGVTLGSLLAGVGRPAHQCRAAATGVGTPSVAGTNRAKSNGER